MDGIKSFNSSNMIKDDDTGGSSFVFFFLLNSIGMYPFTVKFSIKIIMFRINNAISSRVKMNFFLNVTIFNKFLMSF